jgi:hypothetical protein
MTRNGIKAITAIASLTIQSAVGQRHPQGHPGRSQKRQRVSPAQDIDAGFKKRQEAREGDGEEDRESQVEEITGRDQRRLPPSGIAIAVEDGDIQKLPVQERPTPSQ